MDDFVTITEATRIMGVSRWTLYRLIDAGQLQTYRSPINRRVKLVKRADLERLMTPTPIERDEGKAAA
jgi:excisionase family DNA binding protein